MQGPLPSHSMPSAHAASRCQRLSILRLHWVWTIGILIFLSSTWAPMLYAQSQETGETVPNGTVPGDDSTTLLYLPILVNQALAVTPTPPPVPTPTFTAIPVDGPPTDRPAPEHPDLNLAIRSYIVITDALTLVDNDGPTDENAPQLDGIFVPTRLPTFTATYQVYDWDWTCGENGCRGEPLATPPVSLLTLATTPGEPLHIPTRGPQIYAGGFKALVLYADANHITLAYTRHDTAAIGYLIHLEDIQVDPALLALYQEKDSAGRAELPALHNNEPFATALGTTIKVAIRDTGTFMDPRSRKDWW
ncbi:MAG: hypothetical protein KDE19_06215, partial [Caldilineaceae bacterium]|nr:hypothetical protein [Caldilineaceae bacterium]